MNEHHHANLLKARELVVVRRRAAVARLVRTMDQNPEHIDNFLKAIVEHQKLIDVLDQSINDELKAEPEETERA